MTDQNFITELVAVEGALTPVAFRRSARAKRVSLRIDPNAGGILITLPLRSSRRAGFSILQANEAWAAERLRAMPPALPFSSGAVIPVRGEPHVIVPVPGHAATRIEDGKILVSGSPEFLVRRVTDALKKLARSRLAGMTVEKAAGAALKPKAVRIKDTRSRWGSCAPDGTLAFCWRLILAPDFVQDYVVGHEVAHLRHMNHGQRFWALTEALTPHRAAATAWLEAHGPALLRIG